VKDEAQPCEICELEEALRGRSRGIRQQLQLMNPVTDRRYEGLFQELIYADQSLAMLKGKSKRRSKPAKEAP